MKALLAETLAVVTIGGLLGLAANALSPRGVTLGRNYFPAETGTPSTHIDRTNHGSGAVLTNATVQSRLVAHGIQFVDSNSVAQAWQDPRRTQHLLIFVDARPDAEFLKGHIPGAYPLDYYRPEPHLPAVLQAAQIAESVVLYCNGGNCEDSEFAALMLRDAGIPPSKLAVYGGGYAEWVANRMPIEIGVQNSGQLQQ